MIIMVSFQVQLEKKKKYNPRLQVKSEDEYIDLMSKLNLAKPKSIDINVSRNIKLGAN